MKAKTDPTPAQLRAQAQWLKATGTVQERELALENARQVLADAETGLKASGTSRPEYTGEREIALHGQARELLSRAFHLERAERGGVPS